VPVPDRTDRLNVTSQWLTGSVALTLRDPNGAAHRPVQQGPVYATWDAPHPVAGAWTLTVTNRSPGDLGVVKGSVSVAFPSIPALPPAPQVTEISHSCGFTCTATFRASVAGGADSRVATYSWFNDKGDPQDAIRPKGDTMTMSSFADRFRIILRTTGTDGGTRYSVAAFG
jgi:hypothetical protein